MSRDRQPRSGSSTPVPEGAIRVVVESAESVRAARDAVRSMLEGVTAERAHGVLVVVSELASNVIMHTEGPGVLLAWPNEDGVRVEVSDLAAERLPVPGVVSRESRHGRGMSLVAMISEGWGVVVDEAKLTKTVWAQLRLDPIDGM